MAYPGRISALPIRLHCMGCPPVTGTVPADGSPGAGSLLTSLAPGRSLKRLTASRAGRIPPECPSLTPGGPLVNQFAGPGTPHVAVPAAARSRARVDHRADIRSSAELGD